MIGDFCVDVTLTVSIAEGADPAEVDRRIRDLSDVAQRRGLGHEGFMRALPLVDGVAGIVIQDASV